MAIDRTTLPNLYSTTFYEVFENGFNENPGLGETLFDVRDSSKKQEIGTSFIGLGLWGTATELQDLTTDMPIAGYDKTFTHTKFRNGVNVSFEAVDDDQYGQMAKVSDNLLDLGRGARSRFEKDCAAVINGGFATTTTPDGQFLFSNNHPRKEKGLATSTAGDNLYTGVLNHDNLSTFETQIYNNSLDDRGLPVMTMIPNVLLVPPALKDTAERIVSSRASLRPSSADNDINVYSGSYQVMVWPYLAAAWGGSDTAWYLVSPKKGLRAYWRKRPTYSSWINELNESYWFGGSMRYSVGAIDWRGIWGSNGTA